MSAGCVISLLLNGSQRLGRLIGDSVALKRAQGLFNLLPLSQLERINPTPGHDEEQVLLDPGADGAQFAFEAKPLRSKQTRLAEAAAFAGGWKLDRDQ